MKLHGTRETYGGLLVAKKNENIQVDMKGEIFCVLFSEPEDKPPIYNRYCFIGKTHFPEI